MIKKSITSPRKRAVRKLKAALADRLFDAIQSDMDASKIKYVDVDAEYKKLKATVDRTAELVENLKRAIEARSDVTRNDLLALGMSEWSVNSVMGQCSTLSQHIIKGAMELLNCVKSCKSKQEAIVDNQTDLSLKLRAMNRWWESMVCCKHTHTGEFTEYVDRFCALYFGADGIRANRETEIRLNAELQKMYHQMDAIKKTL